jgi:hypothetical protein
LTLTDNPFAIPFPTGWFHPRCRAPLSIRWGGVVHYRLSRHVQPKLAPKQSGTLQYITMVGRPHWLLLRESLVSLYRAWNVLPQLTVVSDGSWVADDFLKAFDFWPQPIQVLMPEDILSPLSGLDQAALVKLAKMHPLGLKLAAIVFLARQREIFFVDSDILWFSDPQPVLARFRGLDKPAASVESGYSFNPELLKRHCPEGLQPPYVNSGCVLLHGNACAPDLWEAMLATALEQPKHNFNEQSIVAVAIQKYGRKFPEKLCMVDFADALTFSLRKPWREGYHARHYVSWMRHQFYRDAMTLRKRRPGF